MAACLLISKKEKTILKSQIPNNTQKTKKQITIKQIPNNNQK
jgi:hypothetical protein